MRRAPGHNRTMTVGTISGDSPVVNYGDSPVVNYDHSTHTTSVGAPPESTNDRLKIEASNAVWENVLYIKKLYTTPADLIDLAHPHASPEFLRGVASFEKGKSQIAAHFEAYAKGLEVSAQYRPYIPDLLWDLLHTYYLVTIRPCCILHFDSEEKAITWWDDPIIKEAFDSTGMPDRLRHFIPPDETPRQSTLAFIESEIVTAIRSMSGSAP